MNRIDGDTEECSLRRSAKKERDMLGPRGSTLISILLGLGIGAGQLQAQEVKGDAVKSAKERLSDKASDEQRVDNCRVPPERRGSKPRPDCPEPQAAEKSGSKPPPAQ
jgi:hypothetical protein